MFEWRRPRDHRERPVPRTGGSGRHARERDVLDLSDAGAAVLEFSIDHPQIPDIVICGHTGCGGVSALVDEDSDDRYIPIWLINAYKAKERVDEKIRALHIDIP